MNVAQPDEQVLERASEIVGQLLEPRPRQQQVASPQQAENQLGQEQLQNPQENANLEQDNNGAQPNQPQELAGRGEDPQSNTVPAARPLEGCSPETCQIIRHLLRAIPLASNTQLEEMYNVFAGHAPSGHRPPPDDHTYPPAAAGNSNPYPTVSPAYRGPPPRYPPQPPPPPGALW